MSETFTRPERYAQLQEVRRLTGKILSNFCAVCIHSVGFKDAAICSTQQERRWKDCVVDKRSPQFEPDELALAELRK